MVSEKKIFYKSVGVNDPLGMARMVGRIYVGDH